MTNKDFFIGWDNNTPPENKKALKRLLIPVFIVIPILVFVMVYFTKPFNNHQFELGNVKEFSGVLYISPFPVLVMSAEESLMKEKTYALLVGYGKNGAKTFLSDINSLEGKRVRISGTLIHGDGKTLIELTEKENSLLEVENTAGVQPELSAGRETQLKGEILDPKCWFGVMKPGEGKVHKSCAIRCISGGIEPVFRVTNGLENDYYILKGTNGEDINQDVLDYVAEPVYIDAEVENVNGWNVAYVDLEAIKYIER